MSRKFNFDSIRDEHQELVAPKDISTPSRPVVPGHQPDPQPMTAPLSRRTEPDMQISIKGPQSVITRFKSMSVADRRAYWDMLRILMDEFESGSR